MLITALIHLVDGSNPLALALQALIYTTHKTSRILQAKGSGQPISTNFILQALKVENVQIYYGMFRVFCIASNITEKVCSGCFMMYLFVL